MKGGTLYHHVGSDRGRTCHNVLCPIPLPTHPLPLMREIRVEGPPSTVWGTWSGGRVHQDEVPCLSLPKVGVSRGLGSKFDKWTSMSRSICC